MSETVEEINRRAREGRDRLTPVLPGSRKGPRRPAPPDRRLIVGLLDRRPHPARRRAGPGQDARRSDRRRGPFSWNSAASSSRRTCCPADVVGTQIYNPRTGEFSVKQGPVFANVVLADEINRAPAKVQSALLEAMQERQVTIGDRTYDCRSRSWCWRRRTRSSKRARTPSRRPRSIGSCSRSSSTTRTGARN